MRFGGIDEAGYGPLLGPLSVIGVAVAGDDHATVTQAFRSAATGAADSKRVHTPGDISGIEAVALPAIHWLTGRLPESAGACFALVGERREDLAGLPWLADAGAVRLPIGRCEITPWRVADVEPLGLSGRIIQVPAYNAILASGLNKADMELQAVGAILVALAAHGGDADITVDRLGGRRYYRQFLQSHWPESMVLIEQEEALVSAYQVCGTVQQRVRFCVDGEAQSLLTAIASCIAKYVRELHMFLLNRFWCAQVPSLAITAGYVLDARRWLDEIGAEALAAHRKLLVRNGMEGKQLDLDVAAGSPERGARPLAKRNRPW